MINNSLSINKWCVGGLRVGHLPNAKTLASYQLNKSLKSQIGLNSCLTPLNASPMSNDIILNMKLMWFEFCTSHLKILRQKCTCGVRYPVLCTLPKVQCIVPAPHTPI